MLLRPVDPGVSGRAVDLLAGVNRAAGFRLVGGRKIQETVVSLEGKPSAGVIVKTMDAGFNWKPADELWTHPIRPETALQDRLHGERVFDEVTKAIRAERGIEHSAGVAVG